MNFKITGTGSYVPKLTVTNDDLSKFLDTSDEWITQRVGIKQRRISVNETTADMAYKAALRAMEMSNTSPSELDIIIAASISCETVCPTLAGTIQKMLGASCPSFDVNSACSGFIFSLDIASGFFKRGKVKKALIVGSERMSRLLDWKDRGTCIIFGDGAGAAVLEEGNSYIESKLSTTGDDDVIKIPIGTDNSIFYKGDKEPNRLYMNGQETFKFAVNTIANDVTEILGKANISIDEIKHIIPHQANIRIIQYASKRLGIPMEKFFVNIEKYGNTSAASIGIALDELNRANSLKEGDLIVLTAFGGGLSGASCILKW